jgi:pyrroline-5-carboxylate reductase
MVISFIGGGNMATALIGGLLANQNSGRNTTANAGLTIRVAEPDAAARSRLLASFDVTICDNGSHAAEDADVVVLAVKPQVVPAVLAEISGSINPAQLVLSIAAGITTHAITRRVGSDQAVIRAMPNTPALLRQGITGMYAGEHCKAHHREQAERILEAVGEIVWVDDEVLMDVVTAISGSGPAYYFLLTETLAAAGVRLGLPAAIAARLAQQTCAGAGAMLDNSQVPAPELRRRVTSPGGTTEAALETFSRGDFEGLVCAAVAAAQARGAELSRLAD